MAINVVCARCEQERERLERPPIGGATGQRIQENVCRDCWHERRDTSTQLINHCGLVLGDPAHRQELRTAMWEFLNLNEDDET